MMVLCPSKIWCSLVPHLGEIGAMISPRVSTVRQECQAETLQRCSLHDPPAYIAADPG